MVTLQLLSTRDGSEVVADDAKQHKVRVEDVLERRVADAALQQNK